MIKRYAVPNRVPVPVPIVRRKIITRRIPIPVRGKSKKSGTKVINNTVLHVSGTMGSHTSSSSDCWSHSEFSSTSSSVHSVEFVEKK